MGELEKHYTKTHYKLSKVKDKERNLKQQVKNYLSHTKEPHKTISGFLSRNFAASESGMLYSKY